MLNINEFLSTEGNTKNVFITFNKKISGNIEQRKFYGYLWGEEKDNYVCFKVVGCGGYDGTMYVINKPDIINITENEK